MTTLAAVVITILIMVIVMIIQASRDLLRSQRYVCKLERARENRKVGVA
jgi:hypothetical protein